MEKLSQYQLIDVREPAEFASEKISGTESYPLSKLESLYDKLGRQKPLLIICKSEMRSKKAATFLKEKGFSQIEILEGGIDAWKQAGLPVEKGSSRTWAMDRQVRFTAGALVLMGLMGSWTIHPNFIWLSTFVGAGLVFSAITNTCTMGVILAKMPWNQK